MGNSHSRMMHVITQSLSLYPSRIIYIFTVSYHNTLSILPLCPLSFIHYLTDYWLMITSRLHVFNAASCSLTDNPLLHTYIF